MVLATVLAIAPSRAATLDSSRRPMELKPGAQIALRYRVEHVIDDDPYGGILLATREAQNGLLVAVKVFPKTASDEQIISRFRRAQKIESPLVPKLFELGGLDDGRTFVSMEYLNGSTLDVKVARGPLPIADAVDAVRQACLAVAAAHKAGVVHRRLETAKLFEAKSASGRIELRVLGFATGNPLAVKQGELPEGVAYLAPEQLNGVKNAARSSDVWALGVILYELLTGRLPFGGLTRKAIAKQIASEDPKPPRSLRSEIPWQLEQTILRCLNKAPAGRVESAEELAEVLQPFALGTAPLPSISVEPTMLSAGDAANVASLKTPTSLPDVTKLNHLLSGAPAGPLVEPTRPGFHRLRSDGKIEKLQIDEVMDLARAKRVADAASMLKTEARHRKSASTPPISPDIRPSLAPPRARSVHPAKNASPLSTRRIIALLIAAAVVLGLGTGLIVRALFP